MTRFIRSSLIVACVLSAAPAFAEKDDLALLPVDSEVVAGLNFTQLQASQLWKQFVEPMLGKADVKKAFDEFKATCNVDAMKVVTRISIGMKGIGDKNPDGVIVAHGVPKAKLVACFEKLAKKKPMGSDVTRDGDVLLVKKQGDQPVAFTFVDDDTALVVVGSQATTAGIKGVAKGTSALKTSAKFVEFYKKTNTNDTVWMIMNGNSKAFDPVRAMNFKPQAFYGSVNVTKDLNLDIRVRFSSPDEAKKVQALADQQMAPLKAMVDKVAVTTDGAEVKVSVLLTDTKLLALKKQFGPMLNKP